MTGTTPTDGGHKPEPKPKRERPPAWAWVVGLPIMAAVAGWGLWTLASDDERVRITGGEAAAVAGAEPLAKVALQQSDLPPNFHRCPLSGDVIRHLQTLKEVNEQAYQAQLEAWRLLRLQGATSAYFAYWADSPSTCNLLLSTGDVSAQVTGPTAWAIDVVVGFPDPEKAALAYHDDVFNHKALQPVAGVEVLTGEATGLGFNSTAAVNTNNPFPIRVAVWQSGSMVSNFRSVNLTTEQSLQATSAIDRRMRR